MPELKQPVLVAVIDVGSSSIRMEISELHAGGTIRTLENLSKGVALGKDTFTSGHLSEETMQTACQTLTDFASVMKSYGVAKYRAVATSAVREASNADTFLDRAFLRSGIEIEVIDGSEENRLTYMAIHEALSGVIDIPERNVVVVEVGGGSTDISFLQSGQPSYSGTFALGAVRMSQSLSGVKGDLKQRIRLLERQIKNSVDSIANTIPFAQANEAVALGGDVRFAARQITSASAQNGNEYWIVDRKDYSKICQDVARFDADEIVKRYSLTYADTETLIPALLAYRQIFDRMKVDRIHVLGVSIRDGLLLDMVRRETGKELESFEKQIVASARALARKYLVNENHLEQVTRLALSLFDQLRSEHGLGPRERMILEVAAVLHDVGTFISDRSHHKHTQYIISSSEIFGLSRSDLILVSNIARYHRKSPPTRAHPVYMSLDREDRMIVSKLAAILRIADAIDQDYSNKVKQLRISRDDEKNCYVLEAEADAEMTIEQLSLKSKGDLFREIYGKPILLRPVEKLD